MPLHQLRSMPMADLQLYQRYTARRGLPVRRLEMLVAQVALVLAQVNGGKNLSLRDFMFEPPALPDEHDQPPEPEQAAEQVASFFGYAPRKRRATQPDNRDTTDGQQPG